mmetsp:Transcript_55492/g.119779  ORF Transcript_55492/g.119779 Transcript_55492/m.119779 type:complete len:507 (+) Transcript_55492:45-1565(+)|eukprot:CAMPEP_0170610032 /NCGR_PEP_ID=MMETSP0224-20130122/22437_1 /TAXON_ID=285029 /ORGANISM="Togula jolla, Strain CCCM 725" /LENGTH=506 /DNA_ID=CAMNT_0010935369 /DNA_START=32 /DNA_END=1552 /DNA_ORIENTATION=-
MSDVVVVGGGVAGITAALAAAEAGLKVVLLERQPRLGGRARSWRDPRTGDPVHIGPHVFLDPDYVNLWKLLGRLGTLDQIVWQRRPGPFVTWVTGEQVTDITVASLPQPFGWLPPLLRDPHISFLDIHSTVPVLAYALSLSEEELLALDGEAASDLLHRFGVTDRMVNHFWAFMSHAILNVPVEEASACALLRMCQRLVGARGEARFGFAAGGLGDLFTPAEHILRELGVEVRLRTEVLRLEGSARAEAVVLEGGEVLRPRLGVVLTLPAVEIPGLLQTDWLSATPELAALSDLLPCPYRAVYIWFDRKITNHQFWARTWDPDSLNCDFYDFSNIYPGWSERPSLIGSNIIDVDARPAGKLSDEELFKGTLRELRENLPAAREAEVLHWTVNRVPQAIHRPVVGTERKRPAAGEVGGLRIFLAGDWCATQFPSSMESAAKAGYACAESLLAVAHQEGISGVSQDLVVPYVPIATSAKMVSQLDRARTFMIWLASFAGGQAKPRAKL